ncbi:hypothetical protein GGF43_004615 [Coemansia sp. RSA 2618]|nr:hypothetical protein GGF43_004615 [Coemansia sp. RSA 2618]
MPRSKKNNSNNNDSDDDSLSAASWVRRSRRRQAHEEPEPATANPAMAEYTSKDLAGMRVAHSIDSIGEGSEQVLTLQDQTIDELEDAGQPVRLENSLLADHKRAHKNAERRKRKHPLYGLDTAHAAIEDAEEEENEKDEGFVISADAKGERPNDDERSNKKDPRQMQSLEPEAPAQVDSDFVQFKKPRRDKSKKKARRAKTSTNDFEHVDSERVNAILTRTTRIDDSNFVEDDDDDLQRAIARVRRAQRPKAAETPETALVHPIEDRPSQSQPSGDQLEPNVPEPNESDLVLSGTIEFVQGLRAAVSESKEEENNEEETRIVKGPRRSQAPEPKPQEPNAPQDTSKSEPEPEAKPDTVVEQEPSVGMGLASTLSLLRQRNMLDNMTDEQRERERQQRGREQWVSEHRRQEQELQRERQRIKQLSKQRVGEASHAHKPGQRRGKADAMTQRELEELKQREQEALDRKWAREYEDRMRDYKPDVRLEYVDESGRQLTTKEAYKQLSHAFHGHYSGKNKVDKVMKQHERERRQQELASSSVTHQHGASMETARRKIGSAGIVFSTNEKKP